MDINIFDVTMATVVLPPLIAVVNQRRWPAQVKGIVALLVCALYSLIILWVRGPLDVHHWRSTLLVVAGSAFAAYKLWWQPSQIAPTIEATINPGAGPAVTATGDTGP